MSDGRNQRAPSLRLLLAETRVVREWSRARLRPVIFANERVGDGAPVMTLPGFCANDVAMSQMRRNLRASGFVAQGWGLGTNTGARADTLERMHARIAAIASEHGRPVHLVGWSLGGVMAREYAKAQPDAVASVITMGTPFSGSRKANHAWRLYRIVAGHSVENPPLAFGVQPKPAVPTYAMWSPHDGVIAPDCARGQPDERDEAIELACTHFGFAYRAEVIARVIACVLDAELRRGG